MKDDTRKNRVDEISEMLHGIPPKNILISFGNEPARPLADVVREQQKERDRRKKRSEPER